MIDDDYIFRSVFFFLFLFFFPVIIMLIGIHFVLFRTGTNVWLGTNVPKIVDLKSSSEQIFSENCRWVPLTFVVAVVTTLPSLC